MTPKQQGKAQAQRNIERMVAWLKERGYEEVEVEKEWFYRGEISGESGIRWIPHTLDNGMVVYFAWETLRYEADS